MAIKRRTSSKELLELIKDSKLPLLTLDDKWQELFKYQEKTAKIRSYELNVNELIKNQTQLVSEIKECNVIKKNLMNQIILNMDIKGQPSDEVKEKILRNNKKLIEEMNEKIQRDEINLEKTKLKLEEANKLLVAESMYVCYSRLESNKDEINSIGLWINSVRDELKEKLVMKEEMEETNQLVYKYMHNVLGAEIIDMLDKNKI